jgi:hypothetical protein
MTTYEDLTPYVYWREEPEETAPTVNVGWLGRGSRFEVGEPEPGLAEALLELASFHRMHATRGWHGCELCGPEGTYPVRVPFERASGGEVTLGSAEIHVPGADGVVYAAPNLVCHYVERHHYRPPAEFVRAVFAEAGARAHAWDEVKRSLPVGTSVRGVVRSYHGSGLWFDLDDFPDVAATVPNELYGPDGAGEDREHVRFRVPTEAVVVGHAEQGRLVILRV